MNLVTKLQKKGIIVTEYESRGEEFRNRWIDTFFDFNYERRPFLWELFIGIEKGLQEGKAANEAFNKGNKQYCYIFFQLSNDVFKVEDGSELKAVDLFHEIGDYSDVYVVDKGFNWTYIVPHERDYGPYFYRK
ncbi:DUF4275 family protein [Metabacillus malikii]|nr:DUF4275 family protein [Metabacillus malikii]